MERERDRGDGGREREREGGERESRREGGREGKRENEREGKWESTCEKTQQQLMEVHTQLNYYHVNTLSMFQLRK